MVSEDSTRTAARAVSCAAAAREAVCGVRHNLKKFMRWSGNKERFCANQKTKDSPRIKNTPTSKSSFFLMETPCMDLRAGPTRKVIRRTWRLCNPQSTHAPPRGDRRGQNTYLCIPHAYVRWSPLSLELWLSLIHI